MLDEYVYGYNDTHDVVVFGYGMVYNHDEFRSVGNFFEDDVDLLSTESPDILLIAQKSIGMSISI